MANPLRRRLDRVQQTLDDIVVEPAAVREAMQRWDSEGVLPENARLREVVADVFEALQEMDRRSGKLG